MKMPSLEHILVGVGYRRRVGIDSGVSRVEPREERTTRARERDADARLQDAVPLGDAADCGIERGPIQRVRDDANQVAGGIPGQARVAVERDAIPHLRQDRRVADRHDEAGVGRAAQQAVEFLDLSALALPSHPQAFLLVPLTRTMEQEEAIRAVRRHISRLSAAIAVGSRRKDLCVLRHRFRARRP